MGGSVSRAIFGEVDVDDFSRDKISFPDLNHLDLVLIRSKINVNGIPIDSRQAARMKYGILGLITPPVALLAKWDRVGILQIPKFLERMDYDADNIEVIEAGPVGIQTVSLRTLIANTSEISIRSLKLISVEEEHKKLQQHAHSRRLSVNFLPLSHAPVIDIHAMSDEEKKKRETLHLLYTQLMSNLTNRSYAQIGSHMSAVWEFVDHRVQMHTRFEAEEAELSELLDQYDDDGMGIPFKRLLDLFRDMHNHKKIVNSFSDAEMFDLVSQFHDGNKNALNNTGVISKDEFLSAWRLSQSKTQCVRKDTAESVSGGFVSFIYQSLGLLPQGELYMFLPIEFADLSPPPLKAGQKPPKLHANRQKKGGANAQEAANRHHKRNQKNEEEKKVEDMVAPEEEQPVVAAAASVGSVHSAAISLDKTQVTWLQTGEKDGAGSLAFIAPARLGRESLLPPPPPKKIQSWDEDEVQPLPASHLLVARR